MSQAAAHDIAFLEEMGYTRNEAIDLVIRRALLEEREDGRDTVRDSPGHRAYVDGLRDICMAEVA